MDDRFCLNHSLTIVLNTFDWYLSGEISFNLEDMNNGEMYEGVANAGFYYFRKTYFSSFADMYGYGDGISADIEKIFSDLYHWEERDDFSRFVFLDRLKVEDAWRKQGVGKVALELFYEIARYFDADIILLHAYPYETREEGTGFELNQINRLRDYYLKQDYKTLLPDKPIKKGSGVTMYRCVD